ncbi:MAG: hypothetical protein ABI944_00890 [Chthoniobacterales bacterium]
MEYTDAPASQSPAATGTKQCPLCGHTLPKDATECDRCDWTREASPETAEGTASDAVAVMLSVIPGLGHIYKGHRLLGVLLMLGAPCAAGLAILAATATAGFGLALGVIYWLGVMFYAYVIDDRVPSTQKDEGEEY